MTEDDWLNAQQSIDLYWHSCLTAGSLRKLRLAAVACCRFITHLLPHPASQEALECVEKAADGAATLAEIATAKVKVNLAGQEAYTRRFPAPHTSFEENVWLSRPEVIAPYLVVMLCSDDPQLHQHIIESLDFLVTPAVQLSHLRDVFGNPLRPVAIAAEWRILKVLSLANHMYESRDFSAMPILADALQDAGCADENILSHCRGMGPHVRGCWVVDLILGKE